MNEKELQRISQQAARSGVDVGTTAEAFRQAAEMSMPTGEPVNNSPSAEQRHNFPEKAQLSVEVTTSDTISRRAAIDALYKEIIKRRLLDDVNDGMLDEFDTEDILRKLPSAEPAQRWIPSGEKPPEKGSYLVWMPLAPPKHRITVAEYCGGYWSIKTPVSAWMPVPEPYAEETK